MLTLGAVRADAALNAAVLSVLAEHDLQLCMHGHDAPIPCSYWGAPEAGIAGNTVHVRDDTPLHSLLHEACHLICMGAQRRRAARRDAGGDDLEECAVCYLQLMIAARLPGVGWQRLAADMDRWGYSFRSGSTSRWFLTDAADAREWLIRRQLIAADERTRASAC